MLRPSEIELWVLEIVRIVQSRNPVEDARVELKRDWPTPDVAARAVAGHCNAARGDSVLWVLGIDEKSGVIEGARPDAADWFGRFTACFEGVCPEFVHLTVPVPGGSVAAVVFESDRAPYVVRNPRFGVERHANIALEIPWRSGTTTRSARRHEILSCLGPTLRVPELELLSGKLMVQWREDAPDPLKRAWSFSMQLYVVPAGRDPIVMPFHRCRAILTLGAAGPELSDGAVTGWSDLRFMDRDAHGRSDLGRASPAVVSTPTEVIFAGPGRVHLLAAWTTVSDFERSVQPEVEYHLNFVGLSTSVVLKPQLPEVTRADDTGGLTVLQWDAAVGAT